MKHELVLVMTCCTVQRPAAVTAEGDVVVNPATDTIEITKITDQYMYCVTCGKPATVEDHGLAADWRVLN